MAEIYHNVRKNANHITFDLFNNPWVAISFVQKVPGGSAFFNGSTWEVFNSIPKYNVLYVGIDAQNQKWFCNSEDGLSKFSNNTWTKFTTTNSRLPNNKSICCLPLIVRESNGLQPLEVA